MVTNDQTCAKGTFWNAHFFFNAKYSDHLEVLQSPSTSSNEETLTHPPAKINQLWISKPAVHKNHVSQKHVWSIKKKIPPYQFSPQAIFPGAQSFVAWWLCGVALHVAFKIHKVHLAFFPAKLTSRLKALVYKIRNGNIPHISVW